MTNFQLNTPEGFDNNTYYKLSELLLENEMSKAENTEFINESTLLKYDFHFGNPPKIKYLRESSISNYHGQFESVERFVNEVLKKVDFLKPIFSLDEIEESVLYNIKTDHRIRELLDNNVEGTERLESNIEPFFMFHILRKISTSLRHDILTEISIID